MCFILNQICLHIYIKFKSIQNKNVYMNLRWEVFLYLNIRRLNFLFVLKLYCFFTGMHNYIPVDYTDKIQKCEKS